MDPDAYHTLQAMRALERLVPSSLDRAAPPVRAKLNNALLNVAVNRLVEAEGRTAAAVILGRLADVLHNGQWATPAFPADLTGPEHVH